MCSLNPYKKINKTKKAFSNDHFKILNRLLAQHSPQNYKINSNNIQVNLFAYFTLHRYLKIFRIK